MVINKGGVLRFVELVLEKVQGTKRITTPKICDHAEAGHHGEHTRRTPAEIGHHREHSRPNTRKRPPKIPGNRGELAMRANEVVLPRRSKGVREGKQTGVRQGKFRERAPRGNRSWVAAAGQEGSRIVSIRDGGRSWRASSL